MRGTTRDVQKQPRVGENERLRLCGLKTKFNRFKPDACSINDIINDNIGAIEVKPQQ